MSCEWFVKKYKLSPRREGAKKNVINFKKIKFKLRMNTNLKNLIYSQKFVVKEINVTK